MSFKSFFIIGSTFVACSAFAQTVLGTVGNVQGLVTDSDGASVSSTSPGEVIRDGERFVTSSSGSVTLQLNNGCTLTLQPNQAVTIDSTKTCNQLVSSVTQVGPGLGGSRFGFGGGAGAGLAGIAGLGLGFLAVHKGLDKNPNISGL